MRAAIKARSAVLDHPLSEIAYDKVFERSSHDRRSKRVPNVDMLCPDTTVHEAWSSAHDQRTCHSGFGMRSRYAFGRAASTCSPRGAAERRG